MSWKNRTTRLSFENKLQTVLRDCNLCYNSGNSETTGPRPSSEFTNQPGLYCIRNTVNNHCYFGQTAQAGGLQKRLDDWKRRLTTGEIFSNQKLYADWRLYGESVFEFSVVHSGPQWADKKTRLAEEARLIEEYRRNGGVVYNFSAEEKAAPRCHLRGKETTLANQSLEYRQKISALNTGRPSTQRQAIVANNNVYLSVVEAAECLGYGDNRNPVKQRIKKGVFRVATPEEISAEKARRENGGEPVSVVRQKRAGVGKPTSCTFKGKTYSSMSDAARALKVSVQYISKTLIKERRAQASSLDPLND